MAPAEPTFIQIQRAFTRHLRDPERVEPPVLPERGLQVYRNAVFLNIERFMRDNFPRVTEILTDDAWQALIRDYLVRHESRTSLFVELLDEFLAYLAHEREAPEDPPFLYELAHFEWLENALASDERDCSTADCEAPTDFLQQPLLLNPVHQLARYTYPVHVVNATFIPDAVSLRPTLLLAFRDPRDEFRVLDLNPVAVTLFEGVRDGRVAASVLADIASALSHPDPAQVYAGGEEMLRRWHELGLVLGSPRAPSP